MKSIAEQMAGMASEAPRGEHEATRPDRNGETGGGGEHSELHDHGDGTFHTVAGGEETQHPHIGHALMHLAAHHDGEAKHMHVHSDGMSHTTHHVAGGKVEGPHEHEDTEALKEHLGRFLDEEGSERGGDGVENGGGEKESLFA